MLGILLSLLLGWKQAFAQERTRDRAIAQALATACVLGRRTIARSRAARGLDQQDWSADYKLHARSPWDPQDLFTPVLREALAHCPGRLLPMACDDTSLKKTGRKVSTAHWGRDPLSPPFHPNLRWQLRFLHLAVVLPLHQTKDAPPRALPVWFQDVPPLPRPGKRATDEERAAYKQAKKTENLPARAVDALRQMRRRVDEAGGAEKVMCVSLDGGFCNRTLLKAELERTILVGRTRKDAKLCWPGEGRRTYAQETFTPEQVMRDEGVAWQSAKIYHGGAWRQVQYKELKGVLWRRGAGPRPLRLLVVKPVPYRTTRNGRVMFREAAFLLCTETEGEATPYLQVYFDRWQVEVAHRELKEEFGVGEAQVRSPESVPRQPALTVATYSALHLSAIEAYGVRRPESFGRLPKWQREKARASCQDLVINLRREVVGTPELVAPYGLELSAEALLASAAA